MSDEFEEARKEHWLDRWLKDIMPNATVIRRYVFGSWFFKTLLVIIVIILIGRVNDNTNRSQRAICNVITYAEKQAETIDGRNPQAAKELEDLALRMRSTGVNCPPRPVHGLEAP